MPKIVDLSATDCVTYARVSTESQAGEKQTSLADQDRANRALAQQLGKVVGHAFVDEGISGSTIGQRPGLESLVASCVAHPKPRRSPGFVLALNDSRWGRFPDPAESNYWRFHVERFGWHVRFVEFDEVRNVTMRHVMRSMNEGQASLYRENLRANVLRGTRGQAEQGFWQSRAPFGYARKVVFPPGRERVLAARVPKAPDEKVILVPIADEATVVRAAFERYASGQYSLISLTEWLLEAWPTRRWTQPALRCMLLNPTYVGDVVWGRTPNELVENRTRHSAPDAERYGKTNAHEAIVDRATFAMAQGRMALNKKRTRAVRSDWICTGIVRCRCGASYASGGSIAGDAKRSYYRCSTQKRARPHRCQFHGTIMKRFLERAVISTVAEAVRQMVERKMMVASIDRATKLAKQRARTLAQIDRDLKDVKQRQERLVLAVEADAVSSIEARERMQELRRTAMALTAERERVARQDQSDELPAQSRDQLLALALDFEAAAASLSPPALRELLRPWIKIATFNSETRELYIEIRHVPSTGLSISSEYQTDQKYTSERVTKRRVKVGGAR